MNFEIVKTSIAALLAAAAAGQFVVVGAQRQATSPENSKDKKRIVSVYYQRGNFPKSKSRAYGATNHDPEYTIELTVSAASETDIAVLENPGSTNPEREAALLATKEAADRADASLDELAALVYQVLMDSRNKFFGGDVTVGSRWIQEIEKDKPIARGKLVTLTGNMLLTCSINEPITGETPVLSQDIIKTGLQVNFDEEGTATEDAGVIVGQLPDPQVKLLLHCNGTDGSTSFPDSSPSAHIITAVGNAQIDTSEKKFGTGSGLFDGNGDILTAPASDDWNFLAIDFTIDFWIRYSDLTIDNFLGRDISSPGSNFAWQIQKNGTNFIAFSWSTAGNNPVSVNWPNLTLPVATWTHIEIARSGPDLHLFVHGIGQGVRSIGSDVIFDNGRGLEIGGFRAVGGIDLNGRMDEIRIIKGRADHTSDFTPSTGEYV